MRLGGNTVPKKEEEKVRLIKTTIRLPKTLWDDVRIMAIHQDSTIEKVLGAALSAGLAEVARIERQTEKKKTKRHS